MRYRYDALLALDLGAPCTVHAANDRLQILIRGWKTAECGHQRGHPGGHRAATRTASARCRPDVADASARLHSKPDLLTLV